MSKIELKECQLLSDKMECHCGIFKHCQGCQPCAKWSFGEFFRPPQVTGRFPILSWPRLIFSTPLTIAQGVFWVLYNFTWWVHKSRNLSWSLVPLWKSRNLSWSHAAFPHVAQPLSKASNLSRGDATWLQIAQFLGSLLASPQVIQPF